MMATHSNPPARQGARLLPPVFSVDVQPQRDLVRVALSGELDIATVPELQRALGELIEAGFARILIDLRELEFVDSSGLHALLDAYRQAQDDGWELSIVPGRRAVQHVFDLTGIAAQLPFIRAGGDAVTPATRRAPSPRDDAGG